MYHGAGYRKLGKKSDHRMAMFANMSNSLIEHERIETTLPKAKDLRRIVEKLITKGKKGDLHKRRQTFAFLRSEEHVSKLFSNLVPRFKGRAGGYTRILKIAGTRYGDGASRAMIEFVDYKMPTEKTAEDKKKDRAAKKAEAKEAKAAKKAASPGKLGKGKESAQKVGKTGKAGANASMKGSGSRGT